MPKRVTWSVSSGSRSLAHDAAEDHDSGLAVLRAFCLVSVLFLQRIKSRTGTVYDMLFGLVTVELEESALAKLRQANTPFMLHSPDTIQDVHFMDESWLGAGSPPGKRPCNNIE